MFSKEITYEDYNGGQRTEKFYFNLNESELTEMELEIPGGLSGLIERIVSAQDIPTITKTFKEIILRSYGQKSPDGKRFIKNKELTEEFIQTDAYNKLFMEILQDDTKGSDFIKNVIPKAYAEALEKEEQKGKEVRLVTEGTGVAE